MALSFYAWFKTYRAYKEGQSVSKSAKHLAMRPQCCRYFMHAATEVFDTEVYGSVTILQVRPSDGRSVGLSVCHNFLALAVYNNRSPISF